MRWQKVLLREFSRVCLFLVIALLCLDVSLYCGATFFWLASLSIVISDSSRLLLMEVFIWKKKRSDQYALHLRVFVLTMISKELRLIQWTTLHLPQNLSSWQSLFIYLYSWICNLVIATVRTSQLCDSLSLGENMFWSLFTKFIKIMFSSSNWQSKPNQLDLGDSSREAEGKNEKLSFVNPSWKSINLKLEMIWYSRAWNIWAWIALLCMSLFFLDWSSHLLFYSYLFTSLCNFYFFYKMFCFSL